MANKVVNATQLDADLLSIADAIREKGGTSAALHFPEEFRTAINELASGFPVTVRHCGANATVTARHGTTQETAIADAGGTAIFEKLDKGVWFFTSPSRENAVAEILGRTDLDFNAEVFNTSPNGLILCTAPIGSTVTATNGTAIFTADKTLMGNNEIHVISVKPEYFNTNPISVTCVKDDGTSTTQDAIVDSKKDVELNFAKFYIFYGTEKLGVQNVASTGGMESIAIKSYATDTTTLRAPTVSIAADNSKVTLTQGAASGAWACKNQIDLTGFSTMVVQGTVTGTGSTGSSIGVHIRTSRNTYPTVAGFDWPLTVGDKISRVDVSQLTGFFDVMFVLRNVSGNSGCSIIDWWFE